MENWHEYTRFFTALLVILDPFAAIPIFLMLTEGYQRGERARTANIATVAVAAVLCLAAMFGESLLTALGTSLASFRVGGGMVLLMMAFSMLRAQPDHVRATQAEAEAAGSRETIAVVPIAIPLLAGPGAIGTVIIEMHRPGAAPPYHLLTVIGIILLSSALLWLILRLASPIGGRLGNIGLNILNRLFGLILTAIAVEIMANGLIQLFPVLKG